jgi:hypothetical protein
VVLRGEDGQPLAQRTLLAGLDTMDWSWEQPDVQPYVKHGRALETILLGPERRPESRFLSYTRIHLDQSVLTTTVELRSLIPRGELAVYGAALVDPAGGTYQFFGRKKTKYREVYRDNDIAVMENTAAYPRAMVVNRARIPTGSATALDLIETQPFLPREEVVLSPGTTVEEAGAPGAAGRSSAGSPEGTAAIERYGLHEVDVRVDSPGEVYLVLSDSYYPGWRAFVDGTEQRLLRGDVLFRAVQVPAGQHSVVFRFEPVSLRLGLALSACALVVVLGLLAFAVRRRP